MVQVDRVQQLRVPYPQTLQFLHPAHVIRWWSQFILRHFLTPEKASEEPAFDSNLPLVAGDHYADAFQRLLDNPSADKYATELAGFC